MADATGAVWMLALPVAAIAGWIADDSWRAARWATYAGAGYTYGITAWMITREQCHSTDALAYIWTPFAATGGAIATAIR